MKQFESLYNESRKLEEVFGQHHDVRKYMLRENLMSLLTEIAEFANETRCFKYWSLKGPSEKNIVLEEYADCVLMVFVYFYYLGVSLDDKFDIIEDENINDQFIKLFRLCSNLKDNYNQEYIKKIFAELIAIGRSLQFTDTDIIESCLKKIEIIKKRLDVDSNY